MRKKPSKKTPNAATIKAMKQLDEGKGKRCADAEALFRHLGISVLSPVPDGRLKRAGV